MHNAALLKYPNTGYMYSNYTIKYSQWHEKNRCKSCLKLPKNVWLFINNIFLNKFEEIIELTNKISCWNYTETFENVK